MEAETSHRWTESRRASYAAAVAQRRAVRAAIPPRIAAGQSFGRLTAEGVTGRKGSAYVWRFRCSCGATDDSHIVEAVEFSVIPNRHGTASKKSCGCLIIERNTRRELEWTERVAELDAFDAILGPVA